MMIWPHKNRLDCDRQLSDGGENAVVIDLWLARELQRGNNAVLAEPIPQDLQRLVERFGT